MLRRLVILALIAVVIGGAAFWVLTIPQTVPASALAPHTPDLANGRTMFYRGRLRLLSRGAAPGRPDTSWRRAGAQIAVRDLLRAEYFARSQRRNRRMERGRLCHRHGERHFARRSPLLSGVSVRVLPAHDLRGRARSVRISEDVAAGAGQGARSRPAVPVQHSPFGRGLEIFVRRRQAVPARSDKIRAMESRRLSGQRARPLRRVSQPAQYCLAPSFADQRFAGGPLLEEEGWVPNITGKRLGEWSRKGLCLFAENRHDARWRCRSVRP